MKKYQEYRSFPRDSYKVTTTEILLDTLFHTLLVPPSTTATVWNDIRVLYTFRLEIWISVTANYSRATLQCHAELWLRCLQKLQESKYKSLKSECWKFLPFSCHSPALNGALRLSRLCCLTSSFLQTPNCFGASMKTEFPLIQRNLGNSFRLMKFPSLCGCGDRAPPSFTAFSLESNYLWWIIM